MIKINKTRKRGTELSYKRYKGEIIDIKKDIIRYSDRKYERDNYSRNFLMAGNAIKKEILIAEDLLIELEQDAEVKDVDLSTLISVYLLKMLERNKRTNIYSTGKTKGKVTYILKNLYEYSNFIQYAETEEEFEENIFSNKKLEKMLTYVTTIFDEYIYIEKYLMSKNYTKEQIEEIQKEEWEEFGVTENNNVNMVEPYKIELRFKFNISAFDFDSINAVFVSARLGFHYMMMKKSKGLSTYQEIEDRINGKLKGEDKIWDYYKRFLERKILEKNMGNE